MHFTFTRCVLLGAALFTTTLFSASATAQALPPEVDAALTRAKVPLDAVSFLVTDAQGGTPPRLAHRSNAPMNPASTMKLVTTVAALDLLGPAYTWATPVYVDGKVHKGVLQGDVYLKGLGDPKLVMERLWLLLRRVQGLGIQTITGDVVLDHDAWDLPPPNPAAFDGEGQRPYNVAPDALLLNFHSMVMTFTPSPEGKVAYVQYDPPLAGVALPSTVALSTKPAECGDYRAALRADFSNPLRVQFAGSYPAACEERAWPVAYADPQLFGTRAVRGMWESMGGVLRGQVRRGTVPEGLLVRKPTLVTTSAPLAELIRDINKFSNNVMAQQVFLTLGRVADTPPGLPPDVVANVQLPAGSFAASRTRVQRWWKGWLGDDDAPTVDNGSGLSRHERISAQAMGRLLLKTYAAPFMPELMSSLPISGVDGTLRRLKTPRAGVAHLKTGSLNGVVALAGYVHAQSGKRYVLVAFVNHPRAEEARPAVEALVEWAARD
ncbi:MAG: D-alanyl-D-alanine carboxypeptidase/D-alanyl-D-alanine-endopeptidase [Rhodoferax sp.]|nr:D-alanyl-D-alanine carboxypeptidase/D-alanyl-D-alanine-endopeptidase [Rhodoferax sp.]